MDRVMSRAPSDAEDRGACLELAVLPSGRLFVERHPGPTDRPAPPAAARIAQAFEHGSGAGLLQLGAAEPATPLTPSLAFGRELGQLFMGRLFAVPELANRWEAVQLAVPE